MSVNNVIVYNNSGNIPDFLNKEFFECTLHDQFKNVENNFKIQQFWITFGSNIGENYFSQIYRIQLQYQFSTNCIKEITLIVKYLPMKGRRLFGETLQIYPKEVEVYTKILPKFHELFNWNEILAPKFYTTTPDPIRTLIFDDIKSMGNYKLANRQIGLDEIQTRLVLRKIAKFHAVSMVLAKKNPEMMKNFDHGFFHRNNVDTTLQKNIFEGNIDCIVNLIELWPGFQQIAKKLRLIKATMMEKCLAIVNCPQDKIKVLNHGDLHLNNFMFKYDDDDDDDEPIDLIFFDFQMCHFASLGLDLNYFLNTSVQLTVLKAKRSELLQNEYYINLCKTLAELNCIELIPSWEQVNSEILRKEFYGFFGFEGILPTISMNQNDCKLNNVDQYSTEEILNRRRKIMFSSERILDMIRFSLQRFDKLGIFD